MEGGSLTINIILNYEFSDKNSERGRGRDGEGE